MKSSLVLFTLALLGAASTSVFAETVAPDTADRDLDAGPARPKSSLDSAVQQASASEHTTTASPVDTGAQKADANSTPTAAGQSSPVHQAVDPQSPQPITLPSDIALPDLPDGAQAGLTQIGNLNLSFEDTPLDVVVRRLIDHLGRQVNISVGRTYRVTGSWKEATAIQILRDVAMKYDLVLRETPFAFVIEEHSRNLDVREALVKGAPELPKTSTIAPGLFADETVISVKPVAEDKRAAVEAKLAREQAKVLKQREALLRESQR